MPTPKKNKMRKIFLVSIFIFISCGQDDNEEMNLEEPISESIIDLNATGDLSEQNSEQAKKTINGKWEVVSISSSKSNVTCSFLAIEFTEDRFALAFDITGVDDDGEDLDEVIYTYGTYALNENASGNVTSVDLIETVDGENYKFASLTNVVVEETSGQLNAAFSVEFSLPDDFDFPCGNLSGDYSADKDDPLVGSDTTDESANIIKLTSGAWQLVSYSDSEGNSIEELYLEPCYDDFDEILEEKIANLDTSGSEITEETFEQLEEEAFEEALQNCDQAAEIEVAFSIYGTYIFSFSNDIGETIYVDVDDWEFSNTEQTQILVDGEDTLVIDELTDTTFTVSQSYTEEGETFNATYSFSKIN